VLDETAEDKNDGILIQRSNRCGQETCGGVENCQGIGKEDFEALKKGKNNVYSGAINEI